MKRTLQMRNREIGEIWIPPLLIPDHQPQVRLIRELEGANARTVSNTIEPIPSTSQQNQDNFSTGRVVEALIIDDSDDESDDLIIDEDPDQQTKSAITTGPPKKKSKPETVNENVKLKRKRPKSKQWDQRKKINSVRPIKPKEDLITTKVSEHEITGIFEERVYYAIMSLNRLGKRACGFDVKKVHIQTAVGIVFLPIWVAIIDGVDIPRLNQVIWYPETAISNIGEAGLTLGHMGNARRFDDVRRDTIDILLQYDIICVANGLEDFKSMSFTNQDWKLIRPRIRDVNYYYNPRPDPLQQFDMRLSRFIFFQKIIQNNVRSALIDAMYKLFLYLIDQENFESTFEQISGNLTDPPYAIQCYPQNHQMAGLLKKVMGYLGGWPDGLLVEQNPICVTRSQYSQSEFIHATDDLRPPYVHVTSILFQNFIRTKENHKFS